jgi:hypothetical protein
MEVVLVLSPNQLHWQWAWWHCLLAKQRKLRKLTGRGEWKQKHCNLTPVHLTVQRQYKICIGHVIYTSQQAHMRISNKPSDAETTNALTNHQSRWSKQWKWAATTLYSQRKCHKVLTELHTLHEPNSKKHVHHLAQTQHKLLLRTSSSMALALKVLYMLHIVWSANLQNLEEIWLWKLTPYTVNNFWVKLSYFAR